MDEIIEGNIINIQAFKHNLKLYRQWNGCKIIDHNIDRVVVFLYKTKVKDINKKWKINEPMLWFFYKKKFYNINVIIRKKLNIFYANLSSPFLYEDKTIKYIDYDIDVKKNKFNKISLLDMKEFNENKLEMKYSPQIIEKILRESKDLKDNFKSVTNKINEEIEKYFFNYLLNNKLIKKNKIQ